MKKIFTLLGLAAAVFSVSAETLILGNPGKLNENVLSGIQLGSDVPEGFSLQCMNPDKTLGSGNEFTIDGTKYRSIKLSNGAQNTLTLPEGYVATKLTLYSTLNVAEPNRTSYWKEVAGINYTADDNNGLIESYKNFTTPNVQSFDIPKLNVVTFKNTGEQPFIALAVDYEKAGSAEGPKVLWKSEDAAGVLAGWGNPVFTMDATEAAQLKAGDNITITVAKADKTLSDYPQVAINAGTTGGWPPALSDIVFDPTEVTFGLTFDLVEKIHENGVSFYGDATYLTKVELKSGTVEVGPNTVWFGPKEGSWGSILGPSKEFFADVKVGDKIVVEYDPSFDGMNINLKFNGWGGCSVNIGSFDKVDFITQDKENATITVTLTEAAKNFNWGDGDNEPQDWNIIELIKENGFGVQGPSIINQILYIPGEGTEDPAYPQTLEFTLNGEKEIEGVKVEQKLVDWEGDDNLQIFISGEYEGETITMDFTIPDGWEGAMTGLMIDGGMSPWSTRSDDENWFNISDAEKQGYKSGTSLTFPVNGKVHYGTILLVKGDKFWGMPIDITFAVSNPAAVGDYPELPRELNVFTDAEDVEITQFIDYGSLTVHIEGEVAKPAVDVVVDVPEGWDGFISMLWTDNVTASESNINARKAKIPGDEGWNPLEPIWKPLDEMLGAGYVKGNVFTIKADGERIDFVTYLYKGDQVDFANGYYFEGALTYNGEDTTIPVFPENFDVTPSDWDVNIWQGGIEDIAVSGVTLDETEAEMVGMTYAENAIVASGTTKDETFSLTFDLPEGWAGVLPVLFTMPNFEDYSLNTRANESDWALMEEFVQSMSYMGWFDTTAVAPGTKLTFPVKDEKQIYVCYLYLNDAEGAISGDPEFAADLVDAANPFIIVVDVKGAGSGVNIINAADLNATYYDVNGQKIANPEKGVYVKVVDGKASKVVVK